MMKKYLHIVTAMLLYGGWTYAQSPWTMDACMEYAAEHASKVVQARWDCLSASATCAESVADFFPSVVAQTAAQCSWGRNIDPETNTYKSVTTFNNGYGIYASMTLFDGGATYNRWRQARSAVKRSRNAIEMHRNDCAIAVMMAYADAVYYLNAIKIAKDKLRQSEGMQALTCRQEELGIKGAPDVAQAEATVANDRYNLIRQQNLYSQAMLTLKNQMNLPPEEDFTLDTVAANPLICANSDNVDSIYSYASFANPYAIEAEMNVIDKDYDYRINRSRLFPTVSLNAGVSTSYYKTITGGYTAPKFSDQFKNNFGEYVSVSLSIPLFDNLGRSTSLKRAKYALNRAKEEREASLRKLYDEIALAVTDRNGYAMEVRALQATIKADSMAYALNARKYQEGLMSLIDLQQSAESYYTSRLTLLQKQMLYILKDKLVKYYKGQPLWTCR